MANITSNGSGANFILYRSFMGLLTQAGTDPPTVIILHNDLEQGNPTFFYNAVGDYSMVFESAFQVVKTFLVYPSLYQGNFPDDGQLCATTNNSAEINLYMLKLNGTGANGRLASHPLEIRVYP